MANVNIKEATSALELALRHVTDHGKVQTGFIGAFCSHRIGSLTIFSSVREGKPPALKPAPHRRFVQSKSTSMPNTLRVVESKRRHSVEVLSVIWSDDGKVLVQTFKPRGRWIERLR